MHALPLASPLEKGGTSSPLSVRQEKGFSPSAYLYPEIIGIQVDNDVTDHLKDIVFGEDLREEQVMEVMCSSERSLFYHHLPWIQLPSPAFHLLILINPLF